VESEDVGGHAKTIRVTSAWSTNH